MNNNLRNDSLSLKYKKRFCENINAPLVYLVHGRAGNFDVMWTFARVISGECNIIAPQAPIEEYAVETLQTGYSWWLIDGKPGKKETIKLATAKLKHFMTEVEEYYNLQPSKKIAFGFSQGAALLSLLIQEHPDFLNAAALLAGFVVKSEETKTEYKTDIFMAHGTKDEIIKIDMSKEGYEYLRNKGFKINYYSEDVGHKVGANSMKELKNWCDEQLR